MEIIFSCSTKYLTIFVTQVTSYLYAPVIGDLTHYVKVYYFFQVKQVIRTENTDNKSCVVVHASLYINIPYQGTEVHRALNKEKKGKRQPLTINNKSVRSTYIYQSTFGERLNTVLEVRLFF